MSARHADELVVLDGSTFFVSDQRGDAGADVERFFVADVRTYRRGGCWSTARRFGC